MLTIAKKLLRLYNYMKNIPWRKAMFFDHPAANLLDSYLEITFYPGLRYNGII